MKSKLVFFIVATEISIQDATLAFKEKYSEFFKTHVFLNSLKSKYFSYNGDSCEEMIEEYKKYLLLQEII
jgi:hypothetical protein